MKQVIVCINHRANPSHPSCAARGGNLLADRLEQEINARGLNIKVERFPCLGRCEDGPNLKLAPGGRHISHVSADNLGHILEEIKSFSIKAD